MILSAAQVVDALLFLGVACALLWFVWRVIVRKLYRAWHIRRIGEKRLLREVVSRSVTDDPK